MNFECEGSYCYDNDPSNCKKYGRIYSGIDIRKICPEGWHLPDYKEINELINYLGGIYEVGKRLIKGGDSGFNADLCGCMGDIPNNYEGLYSFVLYYDNATGALFVVHEYKDE